MAAENVNKKMNSQKPNNNAHSKSIVNALIVCKSKSHPGKKYYFNTMTGESTWTEPTQAPKMKRNFNTLLANGDYEIEDYPEPTEPPDIYTHADIFPGSSKKRNVNPVPYINHVTNNNVSNARYPFENSHNFTLPMLNVPPSNYVPNMWPVPHPQFILAPGISRANYSNNQVPNITNNARGFNMNRSLREEPLTQQSSSNTSCCINSMHNKKNVWFRRNRFNNSNNFENSQCDRAPVGDLRQILKAKEKRCAQNVIVTTSQQDGENNEYLNVKGPENMREEDRESDVKNKDYSQNDVGNDEEWVKNNARDNKLDVMCLRELAKADVAPNKWFIVVDTDVLLKNQVILNLILNSDEECVLLVPELVMSELRVRFLDSSSTVTHARKAVRFVMQNIEACRAVIDKKEDLSEVMEDISGHIINCCRRLINDSYFVVLLSNRDHIKNKRNAISIPIFTIKELKDFLVNKHQFSTKSKPVESLIKIVIPNDLQSKRPTSDTGVQTESIYTDQEKQELPQTNASTNQPAQPMNIVDATGSPSKDDNINGTDKPLDETPCKVRREIHLKRNSNFEPKTLSTQKKNFRWRRRRILPKQQNSIIGSKYDERINIMNNDENYQKINTLNSSSGDTNSNSEASKKNQMDANSDDNVESEASSCIFIKKKSCEKIVIEESSTSGVISNTASSADSESVHSAIVKNVESFQNFDEENETFKGNVVFGITNEEMENSLRLRCDEWVFRFVQIMEEALTQTLMLLPSIENPSQPPWTLRDAVDCIIFHFSNRDLVIGAARSFQNVLSTISDSRGAIHATLKPNDFVTMYNCGVNLVKALMNLPQFTNSEDLQSASESLSKLRMEIEEGTYLDEQSTSFTKAPDNFSETISKTSKSFDIVDKVPDNITSSHQDRECYKSQIPGTSGYNHKTDNKQENVKIIRTLNNDYSFFKSLNLQCTDKRTENDKRINFVKFSTNTQQGINHVISSKGNDIASDNSNLSLSNRTENNADNGPKIIRTFRTCEEFEKRLENKELYTDGHDQCDEDYNDNDSDDYSHGTFENSSIHNYETDSQLDKNIDDPGPNEPSSNENMKWLFSNLILKIKDSLIEIHTFCKNTFEELNSSEALCDSKKNAINDRAEQACTELSDLCKSLESIIVRENNPDLSIGVILREVVNEDTKNDINEYREIMKKFRQRAEILLKSVQLILEAINI